jgi:hypothetical protein
MARSGEAGFLSQVSGVGRVRRSIEVSTAVRYGLAADRRRSGMGRRWCGTWMHLGIGFRHDRCSRSEVYGDGVRSVPVEGYDGLDIPFVHPF